MGEQVDVVGHETVVGEVDAVGRQQAPVRLIVLRSLEDHLAAVAPGDDVIIPGFTRLARMTAHRSRGHSQRVPREPGTDSGTTYVALLVSAPNAMRPATRRFQKPWRAMGATSDFRRS